MLWFWLVFDSFVSLRGISQKQRHMVIIVSASMIRHPVNIPHQTISGKPRNSLGAGHIRAVNVTERW